MHQTVLVLVQGGARQLLCSMVVVPPAAALAVLVQPGWWLRRRVDAIKCTGYFAAKKLVGKMNAKWNSSVDYSVNSIDWASFFVRYL